MRIVVTSLASLLLLSSTACPAPADGGGGGGGDEGEGDEGEGEGEGDAGVVFDRIGGDDGVRALVDALLSRVVGDVRINAFFGNGDLDLDRLTSCLNHELAAATGKAGASYPGIGNDDDSAELPDLVDPGQTVVCRNMALAHQQLGVSAQDFADLVEDLVAAMDALSIDADDQAAIVDALGGLRDDIVERPNDDEELYNRLGRKPGILTLLDGDDLLGGDDDDFGQDECNDEDCLLFRLLNDVTLGAFFQDLATDDAARARFVLCLYREISESTEGPDDYSDDPLAEFDDDEHEGANALVDGALLGLNGDEVEQCLGLEQAHGALGITDADFELFVNHVLDVAEVLEVDLEDRDALATIFTDQQLCEEIVSVDDGNCVDFTFN